MAEIWVTYEEMAALCDRSVEEAAAHAKRWRWTTRRDEHGQIFLRLPADLAFDFMAETTLGARVGNGVVALRKITAFARRPAASRAA